MKISEQIRRAIEESGLTRYRVAKDAEVDESALGKFVHGERGLSLDAIDRIGELLGLRIVADKRRAKKGR